MSGLQVEGDEVALPEWLTREELAAWLRAHDGANAAAERLLQAARRLGVPEEALEDIRATVRHHAALLDSIWADARRLAPPQPRADG